jgi:tRNA G18 (ribose-2'-O)-methylase SpoU
VKHGNTFELVSIQMSNDMDSLNVAVAGGVLMERLRSIR